MGVEVLESQACAQGAVIQFACHSCGSVLSVPVSRAGVRGPCPMCGAILESPKDEVGRGSRRGAGFVSRRPPVPEVVPEELPRLRPEGRINWRERRDRWDRLVSWFQRVQGRLCATALFFAVVLMAFLHSHGWNLPWNLSEDSAVLQFLESFRRPIEGGELPTGPTVKP